MAVDEFKRYMAQMLAEERANPTGKDNLMSVLITASGEAKGRNTLSNEEIFGNLFIYALAGHETTANSLAYAIMLLAADEEVQSWVREEIREVVPDLDNIDYESVFPRLRRVRTIMVRLCSISSLVGWYKMCRIH